MSSIFGLRPVLAAVAISNLFCSVINPAAASPHPKNTREQVVSAMARKPSHGVHDKRRAQVRSGSAILPGATRSRVSRPMALHCGMVALANATWDNPRVAPAVIDAIQMAARESHIDPHLLAAIAWRESRFDPNAANQRSSARGLLQFTAMTWFHAVRDFGGRHNIGHLAAAIHKAPSGELLVTEPRVRTEILDLRSDPVLSAKMAADLMNRQDAAMQEQLGHPVTSADFYLLHVLGPSGSTRFLTTLTKRPAASSLDVASRKILRNAGLLANDGRPMTLANTYAAIKALLDAQQLHSAPLLAVTDA